MQRSVYKYAKLLVLCILLFSLLANAACTNVDVASLPKNIEVFPKSENTDSLVPLNQKADGTISPLNLAQALAFAINGDYKPEDIYRSLPNASHTGVSLEEFRAYIKALTPPEGEKVTSLVDLSPEVKDDFQDKVLRYQPRLADIALTSQYYRFLIDDKSSQRGKQTSEEDGFVLAIQVANNGSGYLSPTWLEAVVDIQDFAGFYFAALEDEAMSEGNTDALAFLLAQDTPAFKGEGLASYYKAKAAAISEYYSSSVTTLPKDAKASCLLPGYASYLQEYRYGGRLSGIREVEFYREGDNFRVIEPISENLEDRAAQLLVYDFEVFKRPVGINRAVLSSGDVHPLLGPITNLELLNASPDGKSDIVKASYYGISFLIKGQASLTELSWQGSLEAIELDSQIFSLGQSIHVGMSLADFYQLHPFYLDNDRILRMNSLFPDVRLDYEAQDGVISKLILSRPAS